MAEQLHETPFFIVTAKHNSYAIKSTSEVLSVLQGAFVSKTEVIVVTDHYETSPLYTRETIIEAMLCGEEARRFRGECEACIGRHGRLLVFISPVLAMKFEA